MTTLSLSEPFVLKLSYPIKFARVYTGIIKKLGYVKKSMSVQLGSCEFEIEVASIMDALTAVNNIRYNFANIQNANEMWDKGLLEKSRYEKIIAKYMTTKGE